MADRITNVGPRKGHGRTAENEIIGTLGTHGRESRPEMIRRFREHYTKQLSIAQAALALTDDQLIVETYTGVWAQNGRKEVTE